MTSASFSPGYAAMRLRQLGGRKLFRDAFSLSAGRGLNLFLGVLSTLIYGLVFSKSEIATLSLFDMVLGFVLAFGVTWSASGITRFGKAELLTQRTLSHTSTTRLYLLLPVVVLAGSAMLLFRWALLDYLGVSQQLFVVYLILGMLVAVLHDQVSSLLAAMEDHLANALFFVGQGIAKLGILAVFFFGLLEPSVLRFVVATVWTDIILVTLLLCRLPDLGRNHLYPPQRVSWKEFRGFLDYVSPQLIGFSGIYVINWIDVYFIRRHGTMDDLGAYQFLYSIFVKLSLFALIANAILFPRIMAWKQEDPAAVSRFTRLAPHWLFLVTILGSAIMLPSFPPLLDLFFGSKYARAYGAFGLLLCALPCCFLSYTMIPVLNSYDRVKYVQATNIVAALCNLVLDAVLVPRHGLIGAALGTFVAYWIKSLLLVPPVHHQFGVRLTWILALHLVLAATAAWLYASGIATA